MPMRRVLAAAIFLAATAPAAAEATACTVLASLPVTITVPGRYCLDRDFVADFATHPIILASNDVVLDCNDHRIEHTGGDDPWIGVLAVNRQGNTVRNCGLSGLREGIVLRETAAGASLNNRVIGNEIRHVGGGINVQGSANLIRDNRISDPVIQAYQGASGINLSSYDERGAGNELRDNLILDFDVAGPELAINLEGVHNTLLVGNVVAGLREHAGASANGVYGVTDASAAVGNVLLGIASDPPNGDYDFGLHLGPSQPVTEDKRSMCTANVAGGWMFPIVPSGDFLGPGCLTSGNTVY